MLFERMYLHLFLNTMLKVFFKTLQINTLVKVHKLYYNFTIKVKIDCNFVEHTMAQ